MTTLIKLAALKEIGAIEYRLHDTQLDGNIKLHVIRRSLDNLIDTTPRNFWGIISRCRAALNAGDTLELIAGLALIRSMIPVTYGCAPAGAHFISNGAHLIKRKDGVQGAETGRMYPHYPAAHPVRLID